MHTTYNQMDRFIFILTSDFGFMDSGPEFVDITNRCCDNIQFIVFNF